MNSLKEKLAILYTSRSGIRIATTTALIAYPLGCIAFLLLPDRFDFIGGGLLILAFLGFAYTLPSYIQRVALMPQVLRFVDKDCQLDELEIDLRRRAQAFAYQVFSILVLGGIMYLVIASDRANSEASDIWMPAVDDHWLAILFGALFYALLLPLAYLAWRMPKPVVDDENGESVEPVRDPESERREAIVITGMSTGLALGILLFDNAFLWLAIGTGMGFLVNFLRRRAGDRKQT